jgi:hypothetical protein
MNQTELFKYLGAPLVAAFRTADIEAAGILGRWADGVLRWRTAGFRCFDGDGQAQQLAHDQVPANPTPEASAPRPLRAVESRHCANGGSSGEPPHRQ